MKTGVLKILFVTLILCVTLFSVSCTNNNRVQEGEGVHVCDFSLQKSDQSFHWSECSCGRIGSGKIAHSYSSEWKYDNKDHYYQCECGAKQGSQPHQWEQENGDVDGKKCSICGFILTEYRGIEFATLTLDGESVYGKVSNATAEFFFENEVKINGDAYYEISKDSLGLTTVANKTLSLSVGDNVVFLFVYVNGEVVEGYRVTIRRRPIYKVDFNVNGGSAVASQYVEEDGIVVAPISEKDGYNFGGWDYDFNKPITQSMTANASWSAQTNIPYTVEYYLQNAEDDEYTLDHSEVFYGTTDTVVQAQIKEFENFTYNKNHSTDSQVLKGDGSTVLRVMYFRNYFWVETRGNNQKAGDFTRLNASYRYQKQVTVTAQTNEGYTFNGWYEGEALISEDEALTFVLEKDTYYTAKWTANDDTPYTVKYYLENANNPQYQLAFSKVFYGTTDKTITIDVETIENFVYVADRSQITGTIKGDGSSFFSICYRRRLHNVSCESEKGKITKSGDFKYGATVKTEAIPYAGYDFMGWYCGDELLSDEASITLVIEEAVVARFKEKEEMSDFIFSSTANSCKISGLKNDGATEITIPKYVTAIDSRAFYGCGNLTSAVIGNGVAAIGDYTFYSCDNLTSIVIGNGVTEIGKQAFANCGSLISLVIGKKVTTVNEGAFSSCVKLVEVINNSTHITVTKGSKENGHVGYYALSVSNCDDGYVSRISNDNGYIIYTDGEEKLLMGYNGAEADIVIPDYVTQIYNYAFRNSGGLTSVYIGDNVTEIGEYAFYSSEGLTSAVIGNGVATIGEYAFYSCDNLTSIVIGNGVTEIREGAFYFCTKLTSIKYRGTEEQWLQIDKGSNWDYRTGYYNVTYNCQE